MAQLRNQDLLDRVGKQIRKLRKEKGITQEDFYNDTNIHIARIEIGKVNISISVLEAICNYLEINIVDFYKGLS